MPLRLKTMIRRFSLEFLKLHQELLAIILTFAFVIFGYLALMAPTSPPSELQPFLSFILGVFMPLLLTLTGNFLIPKEIESGSIDFIRTRQSMEKLWLFRTLGFFLLCAFANTAIVLAANLFFGPLLPPVMMGTFLVPTLLFSGLMGITTGITKNAYLGAGVGIALWLYLFLQPESLSYKLTFEDVVYYPFLEWLIYKDRFYMMPSLIPNRLVLGALSIFLLASCFLLYKRNLRFV